MGGGWSAEVKIPTSVAQNSTVHSVALDHSTQTIVNLNVTTVSLVAILGLLFSVFLCVIYAFIKSSHATHNQRINTLASLSGFGPHHLSSGNRQEETNTESQV